MARTRNPITRRSAIETARRPAKRGSTGIWHPCIAPEAVQAFSASRHVGTALRETFKSFSRALTGSVAGIGLSLNGWFAMRTLWEHDGLNQVKLARDLDITPAAVVGLVNSLERLGFVERRRSPVDRRAQHVHLTAAGRRLRGKATAQALQVDTMALQGISVREVESLLLLLDRMRRNLAEAQQALP